MTFTPEEGAQILAIDFWPLHGTRYDARIGIVEICRNDNQRLVVSKIGGALSVRMRLFTQRAIVCRVWKRHFKEVGR